MQDAEWDPYEVANQLAGYVDLTTPEELADFLLLQAAEAEKMAERIIALEAQMKEAETALVLAAGRLRWCATASPGCGSERGKELAAIWADETLMPTWR